MSDVQTAISDAQAALADGTVPTDAKSVSVLMNTLSKTIDNSVKLGM